MGEVDTLLTTPEEVTRLPANGVLEVPFSSLSPPVGRLMSAEITVFGAGSVTLQATNAAGDVVLEQTVRLKIACEENQFIQTMHLACLCCRSQHRQECLQI